jgi:hypothetical protein
MRLDTLTIAHTRAQIKGAMPESGPPFKIIADEMIRSFGKRLEREAARLKDNFPDPVKEPASNALARSFVASLESHADGLLRGDKGLRSEILESAALQRDLREFGAWLMEAETLPLRSSLSQEIEEFLGDMNVWAGFSYSETRRKLRQLQQSITRKGAPNKRPQTRKILDARVVNGWSYARLAAEFCDCDKRKHDSHCADSIRKRIKELEAFLREHKIVYSESQEPPKKK